MTGDIINLRQKRKAKSRSLDAQKAAENRAFYGRPKRDRLLDEAEAMRAGKVLDGHRLSPQSKDANGEEGKT